MKKYSLPKVMCKYAQVNITILYRIRELILYSDGISPKRVTFYFCCVFYLVSFSRKEKFSWGFAKLRVPFPSHLSSVKMKH